MPQLFNRMTKKLPPPTPEGHEGRLFPPEQNHYATATNFDKEKIGKSFPQLPHSKFLEAFFSRSSVPVSGEQTLCFFGRR